LSRLSYRSLVRHRIQHDGEAAEIGTVDELLVALEVLNRDHDREILAQLTPVLAGIVAARDRPAPANLKLLLKALSTADRLFVIDALGARLPELIESAVELRNLLVSLADLDVERRLLDRIGSDGLRTLISTSQELSEIVEWLYADCEIRILEMLGADTLRKRIVSAQDLATLLRKMAPARHAALIGLLDWTFVLGLLRSGHELVLVLAALNAEYGAALLDRFGREDLIALIGDAQTWGLLRHRLSSRTLALVLAKLEVSPNAA
jgi:hypothetical protein